MKHTTKSFVLGIALIATAAAANAAGNQFGVKGGVAVQKLGGDDVEGDDLESRTGFVGGAYFQCDFTDNVGLRVEGLYFMKGATADEDSLVDAELTIKLDYIEFPVLLVANVPFGEGNRLSVFGGPTLGLNLGSEAEFSIDDFSADFDIGDAISSFEFGLTFGAGLSFDVGSVMVGVDGRYGFGLTTVIDDEADFDDDGIPDFGGDDLDVTNQGFAVMASVGFPLGSE
jgi:opacity protein-like surface antigen